MKTIKTKSIFFLLIIFISTGFFIINTVGSTTNPPMAPYLEPIYPIPVVDDIDLSWSVDDSNYGYYLYVIKPTESGWQIAEIITRGYIGAHTYHPETDGLYSFSIIAYNQYGNSPRSNIQDAIVELSDTSGELANPFIEINDGYLNTLSLSDVFVKLSCDNAYLMVFEVSGIPMDNPGAIPYSTYFHFGSILREEHVYPNNTIIIKVRFFDDDPEGYNYIQASDDIIYGEMPEPDPDPDPDPDPFDPDPFDPFDYIWLYVLFGIAVVVIFVIYRNYRKR